MIDPVVVAFVVIAALFTMGCAQDHKVCKENSCSICPAYGLFDTDKRCKDVDYDISAGNVFWSVVFSETIFIPVILIGWNIYEVNCDIEHCS